MGFCYQVGSETGGLNLKSKERRRSEVRLAASLLGNPSRADSWSRDCEKTMGGRKESWNHENFSGQWL